MNKDTPDLAAVAQEVLRLGTCIDGYRLHRHALALARGYLAAVGALEADRKALLKTLHEVEQTLGKALGYPTLYPEASPVDDGQVGVGDHVPETLATEAAKALEAERAKVERLREALEALVDNCSNDGFEDEQCSCVFGCGGNNLRLGKWGKHQPDCPLVLARAALKEASESSDRPS